jgi:hypothetical protein
MMHGQQNVKFSGRVWRQKCNWVFINLLETDDRCTFYADCRYLASTGTCPYFIYLTVFSRHTMYCWNLKSDQKGHFKFTFIFVYFWTSSARNISHRQGSQIWWRIVIHVYVSETNIRIHFPIIAVLIKEWFWFSDSSLWSSHGFRNISPWH